MILMTVDRRSQGHETTGCWVDHGRVPEALSGVIAGLGKDDWPVNLVLADDNLVSDLNGRYRNKSGVTDVLSFSYLLAEGAAPPDLAAGQRGAARDLWGEQPLDVVGDIILAPDFVVRRCRREHWPVADEFTLLVFHGLLHLLGWDHEEPRQRCAMRELETGLMARMGMPHPLMRKGEQRS